MARRRRFSRSVRRRSYGNYTRRNGYRKRGRRGSKIRGYTISRGGIRL